MQSSLITHQHLPIPSLVSYGEIEELVRRFIRFLEQVPPLEQRAIHYQSPFPRGSATGYCDARGRNGKDEKEYFHWSPEIERDREYERLYHHDPIAREFFNAAASVFRTAEAMTCALFEQPLLRPYRDRCISEDNKVYNGHLRILCYTPGEGAFRAKGHYDKGLGTIALGESGPGLRIGCCAKHEPTRIVHQDGAAIFMPGHLLWEDSHGDIMPAWHDVVPVHMTPPISPRCARWAVVFFINDKEGRYPSWEDVHRPLPVHEPFAR